MTKSEFQKLTEQPLLLDGATGSNLLAAGMPRGVSPERWVLAHPEVLLRLQRSYVDAGSQVLYAPTFGANRAMMASRGDGGDLTVLNLDLVALSREAAGGRALVAGDVTTSGKVPDAAPDYTYADALALYREQIAALDAAGVDLIVVETMFSAAEAMAAVEAGASQVQGTYIGFGERCGNTNLSTIIPNLQMKKGYRCIPEDKLVRLGKTARYIAQVTNLVLSPNMPYVGRSAFAHKGGMHVDGVAKNTLSFEHITPESVGNRRQILLSEFAGRTAIAGKIAALDSSITRDSQVTAELIEKLKGLEYQGFAFESAAASFELFALKQLGKYRPAFDLEYFKTLGEQPAVNVERCCSAIVKVRVGESIEMTSAEGDGPVHALDIALRKALEVFYPCLSQVRLIDYKVRVMEGHRATAALVRVLIESTDGVSTWTTVGCSADIIDASWQALRDSMEYKLMKDGAVSGPVA